MTLAVADAPEALEACWQTLAFNDDELDRLGRSVHKTLLGRGERVDPPIIASRLRQLRAEVSICVRAYVLVCARRDIRYRTWGAPAQFNSLCR